MHAHTDEISGYFCARPLACVHRTIVGHISTDNGARFAPRMEDTRVKKPSTYWMERLIKMYVVYKYHPNETEEPGIRHR